MYDSIQIHFCMQSKEMSKRVGNALQTGFLPLYVDWVFRSFRLRTVPEDDAELVRSTHPLLQWPRSGQRIPVGYGAEGSAGRNHGQNRGTSFKTRLIVWFQEDRGQDEGLGNYAGPFFVQQITVPLTYEYRLRHARAVEFSGAVSVLSAAVSETKATTPTPASARTAPRVLVNYRRIQGQAADEASASASPLGKLQKGVAGPLHTVALAYANGVR